MQRQVAGLALRTSRAQPQRRLFSSTAQSKAVVTAEPASSKAVAAPAKKTGGGFSQSVAWFSAGAALSLGLGYVQLSYDVEAYSAKIDAALADLRLDTLGSQK
eukprot:CAMPEP_0184532542 /NCGR_PEP_ID=MMETSP0198_2-20121128/14225_1 /TAXON_ID=1112570 /ORGANISM="Thraustochytrium sp., Strain LLF1b" /LENGTH=102 /DNA_ID=CAMNT_0026925151 /DNA_START=149 /DNA_END=457 /DNA_ORIENTATION=-